MDGSGPVRNPQAATLFGFGCASLLGYRYSMPKSVAAVSSPGAVAFKAFSLATMLCVGTFATALGGLAAYLDVKNIYEFSALARAKAPGQLRAIENALGIERKTVAPTPEEEVAWKKLDDKLKTSWEAGDWAKFDEGVKESFALYFDDRPSPSDATPPPASDAN